MTDHPGPDETEREAADELARLGQEMRLDEPKSEIDWQAAYASVVGKATRAPYLEAQLDEARTAMVAFQASARAMRRDRDRMSAGLRRMARRSNENRRSYTESARRTLVARAELKAHRELAEQGWGRPSVRVMEENAQLRADLASSRQTRQELVTQISREQHRVKLLDIEYQAALEKIGEQYAELATLRAGRAAGATRWECQHGQPPQSCRLCEGIRQRQPFASVGHAGRSGLYCTRCGWSRLAHGREDGACREFEGGPGDVGPSTEQGRG